MAGSTFDSLFGLFKNAQNMLSSGASSSHPPFVPELKQLNDMVYEVWSPLPEEKPTLEIIFFHGLQQRYSREAYFTTWLSKDNSQLWLQTWLVEAFPKARILTISYDASLTTTHEVADLDMYRISENLVFSLVERNVRVGQAGCPVVLVGHCLGGLVLKQVCLHAQYMVSRNNHDGVGVGSVSDLLFNVRGMFFYGTPQTGSLLGDELPKHMKSSLAEEIETLKESSMRRNEEFRQLTSKNNWLTYGIGEQDTTFLECLGKSVHVVPEASARPYMDNYCTIRGDHFNITKPSGMNANGFCLLKSFLQEIEERGVFRVIGGVESEQEFYIDLKGRTTQVTEMLADPNVHTTFILGLSGIGKSALARRVLHNVRRNFAITCFVSLDTIDRPSDLRQQIWDKIHSSVEGVDVRKVGNHNSLLQYLKGKRVLMVLDNVECDDQLNALETETWLEGIRSKLIVTTTNSRLKMSSNIHAARFEVPYLDDEESHQLFSKYAFENGEAVRRLRPLIESVIKRCANFPLALKLLGSYARTEDVSNPRLWEELIGRMDESVDVESGPNYRLWATLRVCFTALGPTEQELFLDAATVFNGFPFSMVECIWEGSWKFSFTAWNNVKKRFLADVDKDGNICMHSQLRVLGQNIACDPRTALAKWTRIYKTKDARELIEHYQGVVNATGLKLQIEQHERLLLAPETFVPYVKLRYLMLEGVEVKKVGKKLELPKSLVYLSWTNCAFKICPVDFSHLENLVALDLTNCRAMKSLPSGLKKVRKLTWLELTGCVSLTNRLEILSKFCKLKYLGLCEIGGSSINETILIRGVETACRLDMLMSLDLSYTTLRVLPEAIKSLGLLKKLNVQGTKLISLPDRIGDLLQLEVLDLARTGLKSLPGSIVELKKLRELTLTSTNISELPDSIGDLSDLEELNLEDTKVREIPNTFNKLSKLKEYRGRATSLDKSLQHLGSLKSLCSFSLDLRDLEEQSSRSQAEIPSLLSPLSSFHTLCKLTLLGTGYAQSSLPQLFRALQTMPCLERLSLWKFDMVTVMPDELGTLTNLKALYLHSCKILKELPESLGNLSMLQDLAMHEMPRLSRLPESLVALSSLSDLLIVRCESLQCMPSSFCRMSSSQAECPTMQSNDCTTGTTSSSEHPLHSPLRRVRFYTSSWRLLECFLQCCGGQNGVCLDVWCEDMERVMARATRNREGKGILVDTKVAVELFRVMELNRKGHDNASTTSHPRWSRCNEFQNLFIRCWGKKELCDNFKFCDVHRQLVRVMDMEEESDPDTEVEEAGTGSEMGEEDEADSEMGEDNADSEMSVMNAKKRQKRDVQ